ncbi:MAG: hypothetical protein ACLKAK_10595 [Alkaliphilus sp.]
MFRKYADEGSAILFMTRVTIKNSATIFETENEPINLSNTEQTIMNSIARNPKISKPKISKEYNISEVTVKKRLTP